MPRRQKQLIAAAVVSLLGFLLGGDALLSLASGGSEAPARRSAAPRSGPGPSPTPRPPSPAGAGEALVSYAVALEDLSGLSPDAPPGTRMQLWVAWEPPLVKRPRIDLLLEGVALERIVPGLTPASPGTALLLVQRSEVGDLLYADRWGRLSAVMVDGP